MLKSNPTVIELNEFLPASNSSLIISDIKIFASTAKPIERIKAAAPERVKVTGNTLKIETTNNRYTKVKEAINLRNFSAAIMKTRTNTKPMTPAVRLLERDSDPKTASYISPLRPGQV